MVLEPGRIRGSGPICRQVVRGFESPWHGSDTHTQSVGDGPIVETLAVQAAYSCSAFIPKCSSRGGARCDGRGRHHLSRPIGRRPDAAFGTVAPPAGTGDIAASGRLDPALLTGLSADPASAQRAVVGVASGAIALGFQPRHRAVGLSASTHATGSAIVTGSGSAASPHEQHLPLSRAGHGLTVGILALIACRCARQ